MAGPKGLRIRKNRRAGSARATTIRRGDMVQVIAGDDKGKVGEVLSILAGEQRLIVERVNFVKRHTKPRPIALRRRRERCDRRRRERHGGILSQPNRLLRGPGRARG